MRNEGIGSWTARRARKTPRKTAIIHADKTTSYAELHQRVTRLAHGLRELGVRRGDRVAYLGPNHPAFCETMFAAGVIGAVFVPLNVRLAAAELRHCLVDSGAAVLVHAPDHADAAREFTGEVRLLALDSDYERLIAAASGEPIDDTVMLDEPCMIMYTSGTTGSPKGAVLTHGNVTWNSLNVLVDVDLASDEVTLVVAPLFHAAGLHMTCLPTLLKGGTVVLMPSFDAAGALDLIERHRATYMFGVPAMYQRMAESRQWDVVDLSSLRQLCCGGAPVPLATIRAYQRRGLAFSEGYGMTETAPGALYLAREDSETKMGTAGVPHFFTDVRVVDLDGREVEPGDRGEVVIAGPNVMSGYWGRPEETSRTLIDGWFRSGDVATVDDDGYISIVDRTKDVIISGGENIYPAEVEAALHDHPDIADCAVIGVPDGRWGEVGRALVALKPGAAPAEQDLLAFLRERIARYKVPKSVVFVDEIPRSAAGKILKKELRDRFGG